MAVRPYKGEKFYWVRVCGLRRKLPIVRVKTKTWIASDAQLVFGCDIEFTRRTGEKLASRIKGYSVERVLVPEAKGIALAYEVCQRLGHQTFAVARKEVKPYMRSCLVEELRSMTTRGTQKLVLDEINIQRVRGKKVCVVDDVIATGGTLEALERLVSRAGGEVVCKAVVWLEGEAVKKYGDKPDVVYLGVLPIWVG